MKEFQIKTLGNENLARAIQEKLFELGYGWGGRYKTIQTLGASSYSLNLFSHDFCITWGSGECESQYGELITLDELFAMTPEQKETIKIGDQTYDKAEFEKATENLKPIK